MSHLDDIVEHQNDALAILVSAMDRLASGPFDADPAAARAHMRNVAAKAIREASPHLQRALVAAQHNAPTTPGLAPGERTAP